MVPHAPLEDSTPAARIGSPTEHHATPPWWGCTSLPSCRGRWSSSLFLPIVKT